MKNFSDKEHKENIRQFIIGKKKINAISYIRKLTGMSIKESKELCESFITDISKLDDYKFNKTEILIFESELRNSRKIPEDLQAKVEAFLEIGRKISAVKYVLDSLGTSLKEAKEIVDLFERTPKSERKMSKEDQSVSPD